MRKIALLLMIGPLLAVAQDETETITDEGSGLVVQMPEGWDREARREQGSIRFSAILSLARSQYVAFEVTAIRGSYDMDEWVAAQKATLSNVFKDATIPFAVDKGFKVGGKSAALVTMGGKRASKSGDEYDLRVRYAGVSNGDIFLTIQEMSYNGAHEKAPKEVEAMWGALSFRQPEGDLGGGGAFEGGEGGAGADGADGESAAASTEPTEVDDKAGNYKLTLPAGWAVMSPPPEDDGVLRLVAQRLDDRGDAIGEIRVLRFTSTRGETFTIGTPTDFLIETIDKNIKYFEKYFGENTAGTRPPRVNEGILLGDATKSGEYVYRGITTKEDEKIREAETLKRRGEKIEIPEYKDIVIRGRLALISPYIYFVEVVFNRALGDDEKMIAEYQAIMDSWKFRSTEALPPPLSVGGLIGDTRETRKGKKEGTKVLRLSGKRPYTVEIEYELPPGMAVYEGQVGSENVSLIVYAQDDKNNWVRITMAHYCASRLSERNQRFGPRDEVYATWKSNFESKARGVKVPRREQSVNLRIRGLGSGKGYKKLEGDVEGHRATFTGYLRDKSGWRHVIDLETRGDGAEVWKKEIADFFKNLRIKTDK